MNGALSRYFLIWNSVVSMALVITNCTSWPQQRDRDVARFLRDEGPPTCRIVDRSDSTTEVSLRHRLRDRLVEQAEGGDRDAAALLRSICYGKVVRHGRAVDERIIAGHITWHGTVTGPATRTWRVFCLSHPSVGSGIDLSGSAPPQPHTLIATDADFRLKGWQAVRLPQVETVTVARRSDEPVLKVHTRHTPTENGDRETRRLYRYALRANSVVPIEPEMPRSVVVSSTSGLVQFRDAPDAEWQAVRNGQVLTTRSEIRIGPSSVVNIQRENDVRTLRLDRLGRHRVEDAIHRSYWLVDRPAISENE